MRYIVLTGPLETPTYLKFNAKGKPSVTATDKMSLVDGRPAEKHLVKLKKRPGTKENYSLSAHSPDPVPGSDPFVCAISNYELRDIPCALATHLCIC